MDCLPGSGILRERVFNAPTGKAHRILFRSCFLEIPRLYFCISAYLEKRKEKHRSSPIPLPVTFGSVPTLFIFLFLLPLSHYSDFLFLLHSLRCLSHLSSSFIPPSFPVTCLNPRSDTHLKHSGTGRTCNGTSSLGSVHEAYS